MFLFLFAVNEQVNLSFRFLSKYFFSCQYFSYFCIPLRRKGFAEKDSVRVIEEMKRKVSCPFDDEALELQKLKERSFEIKA